MVLEKPWFTAGTLQEDLKISSEEVRDDEHLRCTITAYYFLHRTNRILRELPLILKDFFEFLVHCGTNGTTPRRQMR